MKVLSIDWDYFQNVSVETMRECYPDGLDTPTFLSEITWGSHYATDGDRIREVSVMGNELENLFRTLLNQDKDVPVMIANSHKHIYDFIHSNLSEGEKVQLTNIDMHHDLMNDNQTLDCGNWISKLLEEGTMKPMKKGSKSSFKWVRNPVSFEMYLGENKDNSELSKVLTTLGSTETVEDIVNESYDLIFLARSDTWSPPHLDKHFCLLVELMKEHFDSIKIENGIDKPRQAYLQYAVSLQEQFKNYEVKRSGKYVRQNG